MVINSSTVGMSSYSVKSTVYKEKKSSVSFGIGTGETTAAVSGIKRDSENNLIVQLRQYLYNFRNRLTLMLGRGYGGASNGVLNLSQGIGGVNVWHRTTATEYYYAESESMGFETVGKVVTADGREIDFNMQIELSREYAESLESIEETNVIMTDPLVLSLNDNPITVSDEKWSFDIDADGSADSISRLSSGAGYLVLDRNNDGIINDGSEMFGASTGNGFNELAEFDSDGNGWIDENDVVYKDLAVWIKDDAGSDRLVSLKNADVGAIYLGSVSSEFSLKSDEDNEQNAQIRRSGVWLSEDGMAHSIQQLDMVKALIS